jgi:hypothetical protein
MQHPISRRYPKLALSAMLAMYSVATSSSYAALTDLTATPLGTSTSGTVVKPNILFILDGSGSMNWDFPPDNVNPVTAASNNGDTAYTCRPIPARSCAKQAVAVCRKGYRDQSG